MFEMKGQDNGELLKNIGIQLQNMAGQIQNMGNQLSNFNQNFGMQLLNFGIQISNLATQIFNIGIQIPNQINQFNLINNMQLMNMNNLDEKNERLFPVVTITFRNESKGIVTKITASNENTLEEYLYLYIQRIGENPDYIKENFFFYNGKQIDKTKKVKEIGIINGENIVVIESGYWNYKRIVIESGCIGSKFEKK